MGVTVRMGNDVQYGRSKSIGLYYRKRSLYHLLYVLISSSHYVGRSVSKDMLLSSTFAVDN